MRVRRVFAAGDIAGPRHSIVLAKGGGQWPRLGTSEPCFRHWTALLSEWSPKDEKGANGDQSESDPVVKGEPLAKIENREQREDG